MQYENVQNHCLSDDHFIVATLSNLYLIARGLILIYKEENCPSQMHGFMDESTLDVEKLCFLKLKMTQKRVIALLLSVKLEIFKDSYCKWNLNV